MLAGKSCFGGMRGGVVDKTKTKDFSKLNDKINHTLLLEPRLICLGKREGEEEAWGLSVERKDSETHS